MVKSQIISGLSDTLLSAPCLYSRPLYRPVSTMPLKSSYSSHDSVQACAHSLRNNMAPMKTARLLISLT